MKRTRRYIFNTLTVVSLLLMLATAVDPKSLRKDLVMC